MNLLYNPSLSELSEIIARQVNYHQKYDVIVDNDGEVLIELSSYNHASMLNKYKFYFKGLEGKANIGLVAARNFRYLIQLYKSLVYCWENHLRGAVKYDQIASILTINNWLEMNQISPIDVNTKSEKNNAAEPDQSIKIEIRK